jgi:hypothetical protein
VLRAKHLARGPAPANGLFQIAERAPSADARCELSSGSEPAHGQSDSGIWLLRGVVLAMGEDVFGCPTREIEADPIRQEAKAGDREVRTPFSHQHRIKLVLEGV